MEKENIYVMDKIGLLCTFIVGFQLSRYLFRILYNNFLATTLQINAVNLKETGKWAVVTGATDGIGKAYAELLAKKGLNVVLISRTQAKLDDVAREIDRLVLSKGLNFAINPKTVPKFDIIAAIEKTAQNLPTDNGNQYRIRAKIALEKQYKIKDNLTPEEKLSINSLQRDESIKILPADKSNATVIIDKDIYNTKIMTLLNKRPYSKLNKDPTKSIESKMYRTLFKYKHEFNDFERRKLTPHHSKPSYFYGLPKTHKQNIPLRPIVSSMNSPCHNLAKFLLKIIDPLSGNTDSYIKNSKHFIEKIYENDIHESHLMVSFDVVSLFTNVPVDETLKIVKDRLLNDNNLETRTKLSVNSIMELLTLCIKTTYFQLDNEFYQQDFGMAMGSALSPILSNIFMEKFENTHVQNCMNKPVVWWRYVDDIFAIWPHGVVLLDSFLENINSKEPSIKFTLEVESRNELPFLDVLIRRVNNTIETSVYRKPTHTNRYLNFNSNQSIHVKRGVVKCLYDRAKIISSNIEILNNEKKFIKEVLVQNQYPEAFVDRVFMFCRYLYNLATNATKYHQFYVLSKKYNVETKTIEANFTKTSQIYHEIDKQLTGLDVGVLVNNVGMSYPYPEYFLDLKSKDEVYSNIISCNIFSVTNMCKIVMPGMVERRRGVVINISSTAAQVPSPLLSVYSASKAYVDKFSADLSTEYSKYGITVQCLLPGYVATNMSKIRSSTWMAPFPIKYVEEAMKTIGIRERTTGYFPHSLMVGFVHALDSLSPSLSRWLITRTMLNIRSRALRRAVQ